MEVAMQKAWTLPDFCCEQSIPGQSKKTYAKALADWILLNEANPG